MKEENEIRLNPNSSLSELLAKQEKEKSEEIPSEEPQTETSEVKVETTDTPKVETTDTPKVETTDTPKAETEETPKADTPTNDAEVENSSTGKSQE
jgi:hypothetical protein